MENKKIAIIVILLVLVMTLVSIILINSKSNQKETDAIKFRNEYQSLNGKAAKNNLYKKHKKITIDEDNPIVYADYNKVFEVLEDTGIIYFGFAECPWCRTIVPVMLEAANEIGIDKIYYFNQFDTRDIKKLENDKVVTEKEGTSDYYKLLEKLGTEFTEEYEGLNDPTVRRIYAPTVIIVKDGKVISSIVGSVASQKDPYLPLTNEQTEELKTKYIEEMQKTILCDRTC